MNQETTISCIATLKSQLISFQRKNDLEVESVSTAGSEVVIQYQAKIDTLQQILDLSIPSNLPQLNKELDRIEYIIKVLLKSCK